MTAAASAPFKRGLDRPWLPFGFYRLNDRLHYRCAWLGFWNRHWSPLLLVSTDDRGGVSVHACRRAVLLRPGSGR